MWPGSCRGASLISKKTTAAAALPGNYGGRFDLPFLPPSLPRLSPAVPPQFPCRPTPPFPSPGGPKFFLPDLS